MCISNTFFATKPYHRVSWRHPRSRHWHQLDMIITRRQTLNSVLLTRTYHSANCDTDHSMVTSKVRLQPKQIHRSKTKWRHRLNTTNTSISELCNRFTSLITEALNNCPTHSVAGRWDHIREATFTCASETFRREKGLAVTGLRLAETKLHQLSTPRSLPCWITKKTLVKRHLQPPGKPEAIPKELPDNVRTDTGKTYVRTSNRQPIVETYGQYMKG